MSKLTLSWRLWKGVVLVMLICGMGRTVHAQQPAVFLDGDYSTYADRFTQAVDGLDPAYLTTPILHGLGRSLVSLEAYDGTEGAPPIPLSAWQQAYFELYHAHLGMPALPDPEAVRARAGQVRDAGAVPLVLADVPYDRLRSGALDDGLLAFDNGVLRDVPGRTASPYVASRFVGAAAWQPFVFAQRTTTFVLDAALAFTESTPRALRIDLDDGLGWRPLAFGASLTTRYATPGERKLRLAFTDADGTRRTTSFTLEVHPWRGALQLEPDVRWEDLTAARSYLGTAASYDAYIFYGEGNTALTKPVLFIEGFDFENVFTWEVIFDLISQEGLADAMLAEGYDLVIVNFNDATEYVQRNAFAIEDLIGRVRAAQVGDEPLSIFGASMGGIVSRYALAFMEQNGIPHDTELWASFDSPHQTATIPLGVQYWVAFFADFSADADFFLAALDSPAARQLLVYHYTLPGDPTGDPLRAALFDELAALGDYPSQPRAIAVANGSGAAAPQVGDGGVPMQPGQQVIDWEYDSFLVDVRGNIWAVPDISPRTQILQARVDTIVPFDEESLDVYAENTLPYDNAPAGFRGSMGDIAAITPVINVLGTDVTLGDIKTSFPNHAFIPTISALDLQDAQGNPVDLFYDLNADGDLSDNTPFDAIYYPTGTENEEHVAITAANAVFLAAELGLGETLPNVEGTLIADEPIIVRSRGKRVFFEMELANTTEAPQTVTAQTALQMPNGNERPPGFLQTLMLNPLETQMFELSQRIPRRAPFGTYAYILRVEQDGVVIDTDTLTIIKQEDLSASPPVASEEDQSGEEFLGKHALSDDASAVPTPTVFELVGAYPNPFQTTTTLTYSLPETASVTLTVYNLLGQEVRTLDAGRQVAGTHRLAWDGRDAAGQPVAPGVYVYRLTAGDGVVTALVVRDS